MNAKRTLLNAALIHFAQGGYEGASLQKIAEDVGIKKPSIYAHFRGKDDLFLQTLRTALKAEKRRITRYFISQKEQSLEARLKGLLQYVQDEYSQNGESKFVLRMCYFPPSSLYDEVMDLVYPFIDLMEKRMAELMTDAAATGNIKILRPHEAAVAYMTLMDGILVEMIYGELSSSQKRLEAAWPIYWAGIQHV